MTFFTTIFALALLAYSYAQGKQQSLLFSQSLYSSDTISFLSLLSLVADSLNVKRKLSTSGPAFVNMGLAGSYAALAGSTVTNTGASTLNGDIGVYPGSAVSGFPPGVYTGGLYAGDVTAQAAIADLNIALFDAAARTSDADIAGDIGGLTLTPGVYTSATDLGLTGIVYLDCQNQLNASWIFQIGTLFYTNTGAQVVMLNVHPAMTAVHVWWSCGSSATIAGGSAMQGVVMAAQSVSIGTGATSGSLLGYIGGVTIMADTITAYDTVSVVVNGTLAPTISPSKAPSLLPTKIPTKSPSAKPSKKPTAAPTTRPTNKPGAVLLNTKTPSTVHVATTKRPTRVAMQQSEDATSVAEKEPTTSLMGRILSFFNML
jgi:type VI secretion system secreted protein VgrG